MILRTLLPQLLLLSVLGPPAVSDEAFARPAVLPSAVAQFATEALRKVAAESEGTAVPPKAGEARPPPGTVYGLDPAALAYVSYHNERYRLALLYPKDLFPREEPIGHGEGQRFVTADGSAWFYVSGEHNEAGWSARDLFKLSIAHYEESGAHGLYRRLNDHWYVLSGVQNERIFYEKGVISRDGRIAGTLLIEYPLKRKKFFDSIVTRMSRSFQPTPAADQPSR